MEQTFFIVARCENSTYNFSCWGETVHIFNDDSWSLKICCQIKLLMIVYSRLKIGKKLSVNHANFSCCEKLFRDNSHCLITSPELQTCHVISLPQESNHWSDRLLSKNAREHKSSFWHALTSYGRIAHFLSFLRSTQRDSDRSTRLSLANLIGRLFLTSLIRMAR